MPAYLDQATKLERYRALTAALKASRSQGFEAHWKELGENLMPRRTRFWAGDRNRGEKRNQNIIDSSGRFAARTLSSGLHAGLTSPARPWMKLTTPDPEMATYGPVQEWLSTVTQRMLTLFAISNLYNILPLVYLDLGIFGTACMSAVEDLRDLFRCYSYPIGSYALGLDSRGLVNSFVREYEMTVRQVVEDFGVQPDGRTIDWTHISDTVKDLWNRGQYESPVSVTWIVKPNEYATTERLGAKYLPFSSCYFETGGAENKFLRESGFNTFPIMAPRWDITGEDTYGTDCPGMTALGDVKQLQIMQRRKAQLLNKAVDPPLVGPSNLLTQKVSSLPGDITYSDTTQSGTGLRPIHEVRLEGFQHLTGDIREVQYRIQRAFYEDLFLMIASSDERLGAARPTAREIDERHEEKLLALGPVLERTNDELLDPLIDRVFDIMRRNNMLPKPPAELQGMKLKVEYISILASAQKLVGVAAHDRFLQSWAGIVQMDPSAKHKVDTFAAVDLYGQMLGADPKLVRSDEDAQGLADAENQQLQAAREADMAAKLGKAAKDASQAPIAGDTALARTVDSAQQMPVGM